MHRDPVRSRLRKFRDVLVGVLYHQMAVERKPGCPTQTFNHWRPDRQIGHKMPVHDVNMDHAAATRRSPLHLVRQVGEIGREYRGCKFDQNKVQNVGFEAVEILARGSWEGGGTIEVWLEIDSECNRGQRQLFAWVAFCQI